MGGCSSRARVWDVTLPDGMAVAERRRPYGARSRPKRSRKGRSSAPARGEVWLADLSPTRGHEQAGRHARF